MKSFISWIGGKNLLKKEIVKRFPEEKVKHYIEVFGGAGWVLFHKDRHAEIEIYNDMNGDLVNLFKCIKYHCEELQRELQFVELFEGFRYSNLQYMTDIQKAARFFILVKTSYGSKKGTFGCVKINIMVMVDYLKAIEERLKNVVIENRDFETIINSFKDKNTLFFLDPPYFGAEKYYSVLFSKEDHLRLYDCVKDIKSKFILTYNDCDFIKDLYSGFNVEEIERYSNLTSNNTKAYYKELVIRNY